MKKPIILLFLTAYSSFVWSSDIDRFGVKISGFQEKVYAVSVPYLISHGEDLDGKNVSVIGYLGVADVDVLFAGKDSYENSDVANGLILYVKSDVAGGREKIYKSMQEKNHTFVRVFGRYSSKRHLLQNFNAMASGGSIDIDSIESAYSPWGFSWPDPKRAIRGGN